MSLNYHLIDTCTILLLLLVTATQLPSNLELEDSCGHPSYLDTSTPLDKNSRCASGLCRTSDNKCGCDDDTGCGSNEVCYSEHCVLAPSTSPTKEVI